MRNHKTTELYKFLKSNFRDKQLYGKRKREKRRKQEKKQRENSYMGDKQVVIQKDREKLRE